MPKIPDLIKIYIFIHEYNSIGNLLTVLFKDPRQPKIVGNGKKSNQNGKKMPKIPDLIKNILT